MLIKSIKLITLSLMVFLTACQENTEQTSEKKVQNLTQTQTQTQTQNKIKKNVEWQKVTVTYFDLEGGFYGLVSDKGKKLLPMNLAKEFQIDGTVLSVKGKVVKDMVSIQQWGVMFDISEIKLIKYGKKLDKNAL